MIALQTSTKLEAGQMAGGMLFDAVLAEAAGAGLVRVGRLTGIGDAAATTSRSIGRSQPAGLILELEFTEGMELRAFNRKVGQLRVQVEEGNAVSNVPHGVSDAARRRLTRAYRRDLIARIESIYADNPIAKENALQRLAASDIDHILDLQLSGANARGNLKALHSLTNQLLGSQITAQLPVGQRIVIIEIRTK